MKKTLLIALILMGLLSCAILATEEPEKPVVTEDVEVEQHEEGEEEEEDDGDVEIEDDDADDNTMNYEEYLRQARAAEEYSVSARDVRTSALFPDHPNKEFPAGEPVDLVAGFANNGMYPYNIHVFYTVLYNPGDSRYLVQNFSQRSNLNVPVKPNEETSLVFRFTPHRELEPRPYKLLSMLQYSDGAREYINVLYNDTVTITEPLPRLDFSTVFSYFSLFAMIGGIAYGIYFLVSNSGNGKKKGRKFTNSASTTANAAAAEGEVSEWLVGTKAHKKVVNRKKKN